MGGEVGKESKQWVVKGEWIRYWFLEERKETDHSIEGHFPFLVGRDPEAIVMLCYFMLWNGVERMT